MPKNVLLLPLIAKPNHNVVVVIICSCVAIAASNVFQQSLFVLLNVSVSVLIQHQLVAMLISESVTSFIAQLYTCILPVNVDN